MHILVCPELKQWSPICKLHLDMQETKWDLNLEALFWESVETRVWLRSRFKLNQADPLLPKEISFQGTGLDPGGLTRSKQMEKTFQSVLYSTAVCRTATEWGKVYGQGVPSRHDQENCSTWEKLISFLNVTLFRSLHFSESRHLHFYTMGMFWGDQINDKQRWQR